MSNVVLVNGSSDDRTEVYGAIREEFTKWPPEERTVVFDTGARVTLDYADGGIWRVTDVSTPSEYDRACILGPGEIPAFPDHTETAVLVLHDDASEVKLAD